MVSDNRGQYSRIGVQAVGTGHKEYSEKIKKEIEDYFLTYFRTVEYINLFDMPILSDVDHEVGYGTRRIVKDGKTLGIIVTCASMFWLGTKRTTGNQWEYLHKFHDGLYAAVHETYVKLLDREKEKKENKQIHKQEQQ